MDVPVHWISLSCSSFCPLFLFITLSNRFIKRLLFGGGWGGFGLLNFPFINRNLCPGFPRTLLSPSLILTRKRQLGYHNRSYLSGRTILEKEYSYPTCALQPYEAEDMQANTHNLCVFAWVHGTCKQ